jgi:spermidine/putrescine-binding protein
MANKTFKDMRLRMDTTALSTGKLTDITAYVNQANLQRTLNLLEDTALSDTNKSILAGLGGTTVSMNGHVNTTTDAIFGPLIAAVTSVTKTVEYRTWKTNSTGSVGIFYYGEVLLANIQYSGSAGSLQTFSADATFDGAVTRTSLQAT